MRSRAGLAADTLRAARQIVMGNVEKISLEEALATAGGYRSVLGIAKHIAAWNHVYYSYAFEEPARGWNRIDWPRGLRDTVEPAREYVDDVVAWFEAAHERWQASLAPLPDEAFDEPRPVHWHATAPLWDIVVMVATHWCYHAGEINQILSVVRGEAWELGEEVEENHISTAGHRVRPNWMTDAQVAGYEAYLAKRDAELHGG